MPDSSFWLVPLGTLLILVALSDVVLTVLRIQGESPISTALQRAIWRALMGAAVPFKGRPRDRILGWGMPIMIVSLLAFWVGLLILGFGLLYAPFIVREDMFQRTGTAGTPPLLDALYLSGATIFTLGYGDLAPVHPTFRMVAVAEAGSGLLVLSLAVTFILSVYPLISRKIALAVALNQETGGRADGTRLAQRYVLADRFDPLAETLRALNAELLLLTQAHVFHPILYYVRPYYAHQSFVRVLAMTQGIVSTFRYGIDGTAHPGVGNDPRVLLLEEGLLYTLHGLMRSSQITEIDEDIRGEWTESFDDLRRELARCGLTPVEDAANTREAFARFREATDPYILAYARNVGYEPNEVWAVYPRSARDTELKPLTS